MQDLVLFLIGVGFLLFASLSDFKFREVPDWVNYSMVFCGLGLRSIYSLYFDEVWYILWGVIGAVGFYLVGALMYYTKQWGGGDAKALIGVGAIFGGYLNIGLFSPVLDLWFPLILIVNIMVAGAIYSIIWMVFYVFRDFSKFVKEFKKFDKGWLYVSIVVSLLIILVGLLFGSYFKILFILFGGALFLINLLFIVGKISEKLYMYKVRSVKKLVEGDWIGKDVKVDGKVEFKKGDVLDLEGLKKLKSFGLKEILIKEGIAFVPGILLGVLLSFVLGNWFF